MTNFDSFLHVLKKEQIRLAEPMSRHTTFGIGGPADCFLTPATEEEMRAVFHIIHEEGLPFFVLGGGANLLVRDKGIRGVVIFTGRLQSIRQEGNRVIAGSGVSTAKAARFALDAGLSGMEFASGIPGSVGGAAFMNAGAYGGEMSKIVVSATTCDGAGRFHTYNKEEIGYAYRHSLFMDRPETILSITFALTPGDPAEIKRQMDDFNARRHEKQPLEARSAGSTFKRPTGHFVGAMIEELGLKGFAMGEAAVSDKHAGFLINKGGASCADMLALIHEVQRRVKERFGVDLEPEVQIIGEK